MAQANAESGQPDADEEEWSADQLTEDDVAWVGRHRYVVNDPVGTRKHMVNLEELSCTCSDDGDCVHTTVAIRHAHAGFDPESRIDYAHLDVLANTLDAVSAMQGTLAQLSANGGAVAGGGGDTTGGDAPDEEVVQDAGDHDYDEDAAIAAVEEWLSYRADDPASDLIDGAWGLEFALMHDPRDGSEELGVFIEVAPWHGPYWDAENRAWNTDDGSEPDEWAAHREAFRSLVSADDSPTKGIPEDNEETGYTDWHNYVPVEDALELGS